MKHGAILRRYLWRGVRGFTLSACIAGASLIAASCDRGPDVSGLAALDGGGPPSTERIEELRRLVDEHGRVVSEKVQAVGRQADFLKLLSQAYIQQGLFGPAYDALEEALVLQPGNPVLHQLAGVSAANIGKAQGRPSVRAEYYAIAEHHYRRSVDIDPGYIDALYGLSVLYVFELSRPIDAIPYLERILERSVAHEAALFVLARAHVELGNREAAVNAYDRIVARSPDAESRARADRNRRLLAGSP